MVGDQIGFDEGGVFEALRDPVFTRTVVKYRHNKAGLVTSQITTTHNVTGSHILAAALGPALLALIAKLGDMDDEKIEGLLLGMPFGIIGAIIGYKYSGDGDDAVSDEDGGNWLGDWIDKLNRHS